MRASWSQDHGSPDFPPYRSLVLLHQIDAIAMNGVRNLVAERSGELLGVLHEIEERIHDVDISARDCKRIRLSFVDQVEFERMVVLCLRGPADGIGDRSQLIIQG